MRIVVELYFLGSRDVNLIIRGCKLGLYADMVVLPICCDQMVLVCVATMLKQALKYISHVWNVSSNQT